MRPSRDLAIASDRAQDQQVFNSVQQNPQVNPPALSPQSELSPQPSLPSVLPFQPQSSLSTSLPSPRPRSSMVLRTSTGKTRLQALASLGSTTNSPRFRSHLSARRNRERTSYNRAISEFVAVEQRRLKLEEAREKRYHEQEMERLRLESLQIEVNREHNQLLQHLCVIAQGLLDVLSQQVPSEGPLR
ncbi:hypothetical protein EVAR_42001_1 [Eumeta japonica]|uniref:Uncharacterized protein n=1 Tax=Eumeta variegata TaxID=151549 RepID=A0A4C1WKY2_EUMVA|nr:hypothetical protein EVAR_42001_1 [Eumeta japonica]